MGDILQALSDKEVLTLTLIGEARGEPIEGIVAVGCTIRNRLHNPLNTLYKSISDVCLAREQYSCWNKNDPNYPYLLELASRLINNQDLGDPYLRQCELVASGILDFSLVDNTKGALYYLTTKLITDNMIPSWAKARKNEVIKGNQTFFSI